MDTMPGISIPLATVLLLSLLRTPATAQRPLDGQIISDPQNPRWLKRHNGSHLFLAAAGDPEGFLYRGKRNPDGTRQGDQLDTIRKLAAHGGNGIYMIAVRTHGGDAPIDKRTSPEIWPDDWHNPWNGQNPAMGLNQAILDQWETWFQEMDRHNIAIYFFIFDDAINMAKRFGWPLDSQGRLHPAQKDFVQSIVRRFQHHKNLIWCVMEEGQEIGADWARHISAIAEAIRDADQHNHVIAAHQLGGNVFFHADDPNISQFALQSHGPSVKSRQQFHDWMVEAWRLAAGRYSVNMSEDALHRELCQAGDRAAVRQRNWAAAMAGAYVMVLGIDGASTPVEWLADLRRLQRFFEQTDFFRMEPSDALRTGDTEFVLAAQGSSYILYSAAAHSLGVKQLEQGAYDLRWLDPASGKTVTQSGIKIAAGEGNFPKPASIGPEAALYLKRRGASVSSLPAPASRAKPAATRPNRPPEVAFKSVQTAPNTELPIQLTYTDPDGGPGPYSITIVSKPAHGTLTGSGNDLVYIPNPGFSGADRFQWNVHDGAARSPNANVEIVVSR